MPHTQESLIFTNSIEKPVSNIIKDIEANCKVNFVGTERLEAGEDDLLKKIIAKNNDKILCPVVSYYISDIKLDQDIYNYAKKLNGAPVTDTNNKPIQTRINNNGINYRELPIAASIDLYATFDNYGEAYSFLLNSLWINRPKNIETEINVYGNVSVPATIIYKLDDDINSPEPKQIANYTTGMFTSKLSLDMRTALFNFTFAKVINNIKISEK